MNQRVLDKLPGPVIVSENHLANEDYTGFLYVFRWVARGAALTTE
jgi:hypothetical protein